MREIKFRAWKPHHSWGQEPGMYQVADIVWYNHPTTDLTQDYERVVTGEVFFRGYNSSDYLEDVILMQYTGLKDKNGVEIYERDILSFDGTITGASGLDPGFLFTDEDKLAVAWDDTIAAWSFAGSFDHTDRVEVTYRNHCLQLMQQEVCEVIGNIYENPELLQPNQSQAAEV